MAIVAADDEEQAKKLAQASKNSPWRVRYDSPDEIDELPLTWDGDPKVLAHYETGE